ncbi:GntP family permease [Chitinophaga silvatica]|uniref:GntP family permease n=1 Tax=Chitinophaga silvatica TaxID=2282649 RepID=A0A3E1YHX6_9BACT|nr:GntP family permease [Chitinophaga silvatica]RFS27023.1 GntP family permease [Chitinophaga silvatica]
MASISLFQSITALITGIILIVLLTTRFRVHAFFALVLAAVVTGSILQLPVLEIISTLKTGMGNIIGSLGLIIILGAVLGQAMEYSGSTAVLASYVLKHIGMKRAPIAMSIVGYLVGMPIFCDSGFIVMSSLNAAMAKRSGIPIIIMSSSLATGLYAVHCLMPPHPGITAATTNLQADIGKVMLYGLLIAIPVAIAGYRWIAYITRNQKNNIPQESLETNSKGPALLMAICPIVIPILLIGLRAMFSLESSAHSISLQWLDVLGMPEVALSIGIVIALFSARNNIATILISGAEKAAVVLLIIGGGGAFGAILSKAGIGQHIANPTLTAMGLFLPFLITSLLKTAQGSSTVAIITAAAILQPLLPALKLDSDTGRIICVLAMGAGSMMISHTNDAYFWVISKFGELEIRETLKVYSTATIVMGLTALVFVYLLSLLL